MAPARPARPRAEISITNRQKAVRVPRARLRKLVEFVAAAEGRTVESVDVAVVTAEEIAELNARYLGRTGPTDVLSFDLADEGARAVAAQIVICGDVAAERSRRQGREPAGELMLYVVHGLLHLSGHDDDTPRRAARMHARQDELLEAFD